MQLVGVAFLVPIVYMIMPADLLITLIMGGLIFLLLVFQITAINIQAQGFVL